MRADNSAHLTAAAARRSAAARRRAEALLGELAAAGRPTTLAGFVRAAGVSRSWLYTQPDLLERLRALPTERTGVSARPAGERASDASLLRRLELAHTRVRELTAENRQLRDQLAAAYGHQRATRHPEHP